MIKLLWPISLALILLLFARPTLAQEKTSLENPLRVYKTAVRKLKKGKTVEKQKDLLTRALHELIKSSAELSANFQSQPELKTQEKALPIFEKIIGQIETAEPYLAGQFEAQKITLLADQDALSASLGLAYFEKANIEFNTAQKNNDKYSAQAAYKNYLSAKKFNHPEEELAQLLDESAEFGKLLYLVNADAPYNFKYNWDIDREFKKIARKSGLFLNIIYEGAAKQADCSIKITFNSLDIDLAEDKTTQEYEKEIVVGQETTTNDDGEQITTDKIESVTGAVTTNQLTKTAVWKARVSINALTKNCRLTDFNIEEKIISETTECETSGDERAIPYQFKDPFIKELEDDDDMVDKLIAALYSQVYKRIY